MDMETGSTSTPDLEGEVQTLRLEINKLMATVSTLQKQQTNTSKTQDTGKLIGVLNKLVTHRTYQIGNQRLGLDMEEKMCQEVISLCSATKTNSMRTEEPQSRPLLELKNKSVGPSQAKKQKHRRNSNPSDPTATVICTRRWGFDLSTQDRNNRVGLGMVTGFKFCCHALRHRVQ